MTGIASYSTTASENVQANTGVDWDEGMSPGAVNNSARQNMADIRAQWNDASWFQYGAGSLSVAPAYASATSFTLAGNDATSYWHAGRRVKAVGTSTGTIYGAVASSAYASGTTTVSVTWDSGALVNEALAIYASTIPVTGSPIPPAGVPGLSGRNRIFNGDFRINQRAYVSAATLAAGSYGHDRWKAGTSGGDYSFTQNKADTTITIATGKSLQQVIEDVNIEGGTYVLSWRGTAQGRIAVSGTATSGSYAASPLVVTGAATGEAVTVEFDAGTLADVQLEPGSTATAFERVDYGTMLMRCMRYYQKYFDPPLKGAFGLDNGNHMHDMAMVLPVTMRVGPSPSLPLGLNVHDGGYAAYGAAFVGGSSNPNIINLELDFSGPAASPNTTASVYPANTGQYLALTAEL